MLRAAVGSGSDLGQRVKAVMDSGALVSDEIIIDLVKERIQADDCANGFLFDGFPRTIPQAQAMDDANIPIDAVVEIQVVDEELIKRITGRRVHLGSGRVYHVVYNPPKQDGLMTSPARHCSSERMIPRLRCVNVCPCIMNKHSPL